MHLHDRPAQLPSGRAVAGLRIKLLNWFDRHQRALPWRASRDPYPIWVSEVMLQQTTVAAVVPYFERFLAAFPTIAALAEANEQQVLKLWEGLGYYRRARHLHAAARELVAKYSGTIPSDPVVWAGLPGVGRYILGAVLSQSFDSRLPIVEANSLRVLSRLLGYRGDPRAGEGKAWIWSSAEALLPKKRVGDFNQALMELGALVCLPTSPLCGQCPLSSHCVAKRDGLQEQIPPPKKKPVLVEVKEVGVVVRKGSKVLLLRRQANASRWQNMWEVPHGPINENEEIFAAAARVTRELTGLEVETEEQFTTIHHSVTRYRITLMCVKARYLSGRFTPGTYSASDWIHPPELEERPVSSSQRKLMKEFEARGQKSQVRK
jgi:A/G-specific adenine glycosylase